MKYCAIITKSNAQKNVGRTQFPLILETIALCPHLFRLFNVALQDLTPYLDPVFILSAMFLPIK